MDYVDGKSLSEIVREQGPLPEERAVRYIRQVATALQYVHDNNRLHLDIKPGNIMIDGNDNPVLIDFGASKQYDEEDGENTSTLMGKTPGYAPLEQMGNDVVKFTPATDIYALGATLYKLLTGITPTSANLLASGDTLEPLSTNISAATRNAIAAAMEINKNKRPQSLTAFVNLFDSSTIALEDENTIIEAETPIVEKDVESTQKPTTNNSEQSSSFWDKNKWYILGICVIAIIFLGYMFIHNKPMQINEKTDSLELQDSVTNENTPSQDELDRKEQVRKAEEQKKAEAIEAEQRRKAKEQQEAAEQRRRAEEKHQQEEARAQENTDNEVYLEAEVMPSFQGGDLETFRDWVNSRIQYPQLANENGIQGNVIATFIIEKDGRLTNIEILRSPDRSLSDEVIRVLKLSPSWSPGKVDGVPVRIKYTLPIVFRLTD